MSHGHRGGHGGGHRGGQGGGGGHIAMFLFGYLIAPRISALMHHKKRRKPRPIGKHSPLRGLDAKQARRAMSVANVLGIVAMIIFTIAYAFVMFRMN